jgi:hypothetical protein
MKTAHLSLLLIIAIVALFAGCASETVTIRSAPPPLPLYDQPFCPGPGYLWVPGYWAWGFEGYYWVPGFWEMPPRIGWLWTPGYWGWHDGIYRWHSGYWGRHVGYYGGIPYGFGYTGCGYYGGYWRENAFYYNTAVSNVNITVVRNTYATTVVNKTDVVNRVSYNGGAGGITVKPTTVELAAAKESHVAATPRQKMHYKAAATNRELLASVNNGNPHPDLVARQHPFAKPAAKKPPPKQIRQAREYDREKERKADREPRHDER